MTNELKEVNEILGNKRKFRRALFVIFLILSVITYGLYSGEISKIIVGIFGKSNSEESK